jgi:hypothetical protein
LRALHLSCLAKHFGFSDPEQVLQSPAQSGPEKVGVQARNLWAGVILLPAKSYVGNTSFSKCRACSNRRRDPSSEAKSVTPPSQFTPTPGLKVHEDANRIPSSLLN